jgi:hypothetical protein
MRVIAVIDQRAVIEKILLHLGLWSGTPTLASARAPPGDVIRPWTREPCDNVDPMPDTKTSSPTEPASGAEWNAPASGPPVGFVPR